MLLGVMTSVLAVLASAAVRPDGESFVTRSVVLGQSGMVTTSQPLATQVGLDILKQGGSAVDAAIAANAALGLMEPMSNGIGGDLFAIVWDPKTRRLHGLNASGRSSRTLTRETFAAAGITDAIPLRGVYSVTVPGCVDGWFSLHERFGQLPMPTLLAATIGYAEAGFPVSELTARSWQGFVKNHAPFDAPLRGFAETFTFEGRAPLAGELWRNPALAQTLTLIAEGGRDVFYRGEVARHIAAGMHEVGGPLTYDDLATHRSEWVEPVSTDYRGWRVWELPPNGQGIAALQILNIMEGFDLAAAGFGSVEHVHGFIEAKKLAYEDRAKFYADPAFSRIPVEALLAKEYAARRRALIDPQQPAMTADPGELEHGDTIILCTADATGMMVALIQSNSGSFGSGVCLPELGFVFQNRGQMFTFERGHANEYQPAKRPFHTIIPAFVTANDEPLMAFGLMGGSMQPQGHAQIIMNLRDFGMGLQAAGDAPRIRHDGSRQPFGKEVPMGRGGNVYTEVGMNPETVAALRAMGHDVTESSGGRFGGYQAIYRDPRNGVYHGAAESRQDGMAAGF